MALGAGVSAEVAAEAAARGVGTTGGAALGREMVLAGCGTGLDVEGMGIDGAPFVVATVRMRTGPARWPQTI